MRRANIPRDVGVLDPPPLPAQKRPYTKSLATCIPLSSLEHEFHRSPRWDAKTKGLDALWAPGHCLVPPPPPPH